jgi:hypothetical protein
MTVVTFQSRTTRSHCQNGLADMIFLKQHTILALQNTVPMNSTAIHITVAKNDVRLIVIPAKTGIQILGPGSNPG